jgi:serine protease
MLKRVIAGATVAVVTLLGVAATAQAKTARTAAAQPVQHVKVIDLHRAYAARLGHSKPGKIAGIVYPRGHRPKVAHKAVRKAATTCTEPNCPLVYGGGPVQHSPHVYLLLWGPHWSSDSNQKASASYLENFYAGLGVHPQDTWSTINTQYADSQGFPTFPGSVYEGAFQDISTPPAGVTQTQLASEADAFTSAEGVTDLNDAQIIIATQSGTCPQGFYSPSPCGSTSGYCAWHSASNEPYTNLPYLLDAGAGCGENFINAGTAGVHDGLSIVAGHEYAESITDPVPPTGWVDQSDTVSGGEIADKCAWGGQPWGGNDPFGNVTLSTGKFAMQSLWSNTANGCVMTGPVQDTVSVTSPGNQTGQTGGAVSLQAGGSSSGGHPLTWSATGLPAGLAINPSTGLITGTLSAPNVYTVTVSAGDTTGAANSAHFTWTVSCPSDTVTVTQPGSQSGKVGTPVSLQMHGTSSCGSPLTWSDSVLPAGLSINPVTGLITGTPTLADTYNVTVTAKDTGSISGSTSFTWTIAPGQTGHPIKGDHGKCLDDRGASTTNGNKIDIWTCNGTGAQSWTYTSSSTLSVLGSCLSDKHYTGAGTKLVLWSCIGNRNEQWTHRSNGEYVLATNGLCLTDPSGSTVNGTQVEIRACHDFADQRWSGP